MASLHIEQLRHFGLAAVRQADAPALMAGLSESRTGSEGNARPGWFALGSVGDDFETGLFLISFFSVRFDVHPAYTGWRWCGWPMADQTTKHTKHTKFENRTFVYFVSFVVKKEIPRRPVSMMGGLERDLVDFDMDLLFDFEEDTNTDGLFSVGETDPAVPDN